MGSRLRMRFDQVGHGRASIRREAFTVRRIAPRRTYPRRGSGSRTCVSRSLCGDFPPVTVEDLPRSPGRRRTARREDRQRLLADQDEPHHGHPGFRRRHRAAPRCQRHRPSASRRRRSRSPEMPPSARPARRPPPATPRRRTARTSDRSCTGVVHRSHGVDHPTRRQLTGQRRDRLTRRQSVRQRRRAQLAAGFQHGRPTSPMDGSVDAPAAEQGGVGRVDHSIDGLRRDVPGTTSIRTGSPRATPAGAWCPVARPVHARMVGWRAGRGGTAGAPPWSACSRRLRCARC